MSPRTAPLRALKRTTQNATTAGNKTAAGNTTAVGNKTAAGSESSGIQSNQTTRQPAPEVTQQPMLRVVQPRTEHDFTNVHTSRPEADIDLPEIEPELSSEEIEDRALSKLARKALSEHEVRKIILDDGGSEDLADALLIDFNRKGYVNDETLADDLVQAHLRRKKQGPAVIKRELAQRGIPDFIIAAALDVIDDDEELRLVVEAANDRVRRMGNLERSVAERRLTGYLQRRGYSSSLIRTAVDQALGGKRSSPGSVRFE